MATAEAMAEASMDRGAIAAAITAVVIMAVVTTVAIMAEVTTAEATIEGDGTADIGRTAIATILTVGRWESGSDGPAMDGATIRATTIRPIITDTHTHPTCTIRTATRSRHRQIQHGARAQARLYPPDNGDISMNNSTRKDPK